MAAAAAEAAASVDLSACCARVSSSPAGTAAATDPGGLRRGNAEGPMAPLLEWMCSLATSAAATADVEATPGSPPEVAKTADWRADGSRRLSAVEPRNGTAHAVVRRLREAGLPSLTASIRPDGATDAVRLLGLHSRVPEGGHDGLRSRDPPSLAATMTAVRAETDPDSGL